MRRAAGDHSGLLCDTEYRSAQYIGHCARSSLYLHALSLSLWSFLPLTLAAANMWSQMKRLASPGSPPESCKAVWDIRGLYRKDTYRVCESTFAWPKPVCTAVIFQREPTNQPKRLRATSGLSKYPILKRKHDYRGQREGRMKLIPRQCLNISIVYFKRIPYLLLPAVTTG